MWACVTNIGILKDFSLFPLVHSLFLVCHAQDVVVIHALPHQHEVYVVLFCQLPLVSMLYFTLYSPVCFAL